MPAARVLDNAVVRYCRADHWGEILRPELGPVNESGHFGGGADESVGDKSRLTAAQRTICRSTGSWLMLRQQTSNPARARVAGRDARLCLKGKDAESEEAQEHANSSSLALYA